VILKSEKILTMNLKDLYLVTFQELTHLNIKVQ